MNLEKAEKALILLHGRGGTGASILGLADEFCDDTFFVTAPDAPNHTWYPYSFLTPGSSNEPFVIDSATRVKAIIDRISLHIPHDRIYLMGFSQGACLSLETVARYALSLGGVVAFTGSLIGEKLDKSKYTGNLQGTKIFIGASENDPHIPLKYIQESKTVLEEMGAHVLLKVYPGSSHTVTQAEIDAAKTFIFKEKELL